VGEEDAQKVFRGMRWWQERIMGSKEWSSTPVDSRERACKLNWRETPQRGWTQPKLFWRCGG